MNLLVIVAALALAYWKRAELANLVSSVMPAGTALLPAAPAAPAASVATPAPYVSTAAPLAPAAAATYGPEVIVHPAPQIQTPAVQPIAECLPSPMGPRAINDTRYWQTTGSAYPGCQPVVYAHLSMGPEWGWDDIAARIGLTRNGVLIPNGQAFVLFDRMRRRGNTAIGENVGPLDPAHPHQNPLPGFIISLLIGESNMASPYTTTLQCVGSYPNYIYPMRQEYGYPAFSDPQSVWRIMLKMHELAGEHPDLVEERYLGAMGYLWKYPKPQQVGVVATRFIHWNKYFAAATGLPGPMFEDITLAPTGNFHELNYITLDQYWEARNSCGYGAPELIDMMYGPNSSLGGFFSRNLRGLN